MLPRLNISVIIPSYNPDDKLLLVVEELSHSGFTDIIVINDGSSAECLTYFEKITKANNCTVLTHPINSGKGAALKTGFEFFLQNRPGQAGVVTVDGDNQHKADNALACAKVMLETGKIVLGARCFDQENVPWTSRLGNMFTKNVVKALLSLPINDTQTGLRAIPSEYISTFLKTDGDRYEYETNMLIDTKKHGFPIMEIPIETVYIENNKSSHFNPFIDSLRIYSQFAKYTAGSILSFLVDITIFYLLIRLINFKFYAVWVCTALARLVSSLFNFTLNQRFVFLKGNLSEQIIRYYIVCIPTMALSALLVFGLTHYSPMVWPPIAITLLKMAVDTILFLISFYVQKHWVFKRKGGNI